MIERFSRENPERRGYFMGYKILTDPHQTGGEWVWRGEPGRAEIIRIDKHLFDDAPDAEEKGQKLFEHQSQFLMDVHDYWAGREKNEGFLHEHPKYLDLFNKYAWYFFAQKAPGHMDIDRYSGQVSPDGFLLDRNGSKTDQNMRKLAARYADTIDEFVAEELSISENFTDITWDEERQEELDMYPSVRYEI